MDTSLQPAPRSAVASPSQQPLSGSPAPLRIEIWLLESLIPYARNARTHSPEQVAQIAASIAEFGFVNPVLADPQGGIIAGHGRVLAVRQLGLTQAPVIVLSHLSENQKRAFMLADNRLALNAGWDLEMLRLELEALAEHSRWSSPASMSRNSTSWLARRSKIPTKHLLPLANLSLARGRSGSWAIISMAAMSSR